MNALRNRTALAMLATALAVPAAAAAEPAVPPENSAANQYTESIPTGGGKQDAGGDRGDRSPEKVLGAKQADELRAQGSTGREVAEVAAETAPEVETTPPAAQPAPAPDTSQDSQTDESAAAGSGGRGAPPGAQSGGAEPAGADRSTPPAADLGQAGESRLAAVLGEATGSTSDGLPWLLPLMIAAIAAWSAAFAWRQRRQH